MVDRIRYPTVSYLPFYYIFFQIDFKFLLLTIFNLQAKILAINDILSNLGGICFLCPRNAPATSVIRNSREYPWKMRGKKANDGTCFLFPWLKNNGTRE